MNIQIFGKKKSFDTKKAERYFKERRIKYQYIDLLRYGMSRGELNSVKNAVGLEALIDEKAPGAEVLRYLAYDEAAIESFLHDVVEGGADPKAAARDEFRRTIMVNHPHAADAALASIKTALGMG